MADDSAYLNGLIATKKPIPASADGYHVLPKQAGVLTASSMTPIMGPGSEKATIHILPGCGPAARLCHNNYGKAFISGLNIQGPTTYRGTGDQHDDVSVLALGSAAGAGWYAHDVRFGRVHVAARGYGRVRQSICFDHPIVDGEGMGAVEGSCFGILTNHYGPVTINAGHFTRGGSSKVPNKSHQLYLGYGVALSITGGTQMDKHTDGRLIQVYDEANFDHPERVPAPDYWHVAEAKFGAPIVKGVPWNVAIQSNPNVLSRFEKIELTTPKIGIEVRGDVKLTDSKYTGTGQGLSRIDPNAKVELIRSPTFKAV